MKQKVIIFLKDGYFEDIVASDEIEIFFIEDESSEAFFVEDMPEDLVSIPNFDYVDEDYLLDRLCLN